MKEHWYHAKDRATAKRKCKYCRKVKTGLQMKARRKGDLIHIANVCHKCSRRLYDYKNSTPKKVKVFSKTEFRPVRYQQDGTFGFPSEYRNERLRKAHIEIQSKLHLATMQGLDIDDENYTEEIIRRFG